MDMLPLAPVVVVMPICWASLVRILSRVSQRRFGLSKQTGDYATFKFQPLLLRHPTGNLAPPSPTALSIAVPGGNTASLNIASMTQLASPFSVSTATMDGNAPSKVQSVSIGTDGTLSYVYANGKTVPAYSIPLGNVISPDNLTNITGDVFQVSSESCRRIHPSIVR
jgi:hypothetical protein